MSAATIETSIPYDHPFNAYRVPRTQAAQALVADVLLQLAFLEREQGQGGRKRARRAADQGRYERQVEALVCDLAHRHLADPGGWLFATRSKAVLSKRDRYAPTFITESFTAVMDAMSRPDVALCELRVARRLGPNARAKAVQSTLRAGPGLVQRIESLALTAKDFRVGEGDEVIVLKRDKDEGEETGERIDYDDTPQTHEMRQRLQTINRWLESAAIDCWGTGQGEGNPLGVDLGKRRLRRIFINGSFEEHGRMYGGFWINMRGQDRLEGLTIDGDDVAELDFGQTQIRLLYGEAGQTGTFEDAYALPGLEKHRDGVKKFMNAMLAAPKPLTRFPAGVRKSLPGVVERDGQWHQVDFETLRAWILEFHAPVAPWFSGGLSQRLTFRESQIMVEVLLKLIDQGITALPIHDGLLVARKHEETAKAVMLSIFREATGMDGVVSVDYA